MVKFKMAKMFFDRPAVIRALDPVKRKALMLSGNRIKLIARRSMRKAVQMKLSEMTTAMRRAYHIAVGRARRDGRPTPRRPLAASKPGEPPRTRIGHVRRFLFAGFDVTTMSSVIGPERLKRSSGAPNTLEFGGKTEMNGKPITVAPRPYMGPALKKELPRIPSAWRQAALRGS